jgi:uncharacterized protein YegJ (DUF2314 family)
MSWTVPFSRLALVGTLQLLLACAGAQSKTTTPAASAQKEALPAIQVPPLEGAVQEPVAFFAAAVYLQAAPPADVSGLLEKLSAEHFPGLHVGEAEPDPNDKLPVVYVKRMTAAEMPPPSLDEIEVLGQGLTPEQASQAAGSKHGLAVFFVGETRRVSSDLPKQNALVLALAEKLQGYPWDETTRQLFSREAFAPRAAEGPPSVLDHVTMHSYRDGELIRIETLGMEKFGLPNLEVNHVAASDANGTALLVNLVGSLLIQGSLQVVLDEVKDPKLAMPAELLEGANKRASVLLRRTKTQEGDGSEQLLELFFGEAEDRFVHERRNATLASLFGSTDSVVSMEHDEELLAASERAKQRLKALRPAFERGLAPGERLLVKAPFKTAEGDDEWMWVEVVRWQGATLHGILMNEPEAVSGLVAGSKVQVKQEDLFDYILMRADGSSEGNETGEIMERRLN